MKLDYKCIGPCMVSKIINKNGYKLHLLNTIYYYNIVHILLLDCDVPPVAGKVSFEL